LNPAVRLGKNLGGYHGEGIDIQKVRREIESVALRHNWISDHARFVPRDSGREIEFLAYRRAGAEGRPRIYISTGIHGDEPAGPLAVLRLLDEDRWPHGAAFWLCPCLNLTGFPLNRRENALGVDLNRDYRHLAAEETRAHTDWLARQPEFDLALCLHEDWEAAGFYVYELNPDGRPTFGEKIIDAVSAVCPIDRSPVIENWPAGGGIIRPQVQPADRPQWAEAFYLITHKTRLSYTLEAPSDFPLGLRVEALVKGVETVLAGL
jgi:protein MpaA